MEDIARAIVLGIVQGLTEFLPVSSSGHLIVARDLFGWEFTDDLTFDVALHLGTTVAVIAFFWREWADMLSSGFKRLSATPVPANPGHAGIYNERLLRMLIIGSIPAGIVGVIFDAFLEDEVRSPEVVGAMLIAGAIVLLFAQRIGRQDRTIVGASWGDAVSIGLAQAVSLVPGVSRSGITISAALARGFTLAEAARFSFLLATPAILGAGLLKATEAAVEGIPADDLLAIGAGTLVSAVVGWLSIHYLLRLVQTRSYAPFIVYRIAFGAFVLAYFLA